MATLLSGRAVAAALNEALLRRSDSLQKRGVAPTLATVRVGERPDDVAYESGILKRCEKLGVTVRRYLLPEHAAEAELLHAIAAVNADDRIHGCLLFRPLPKRFDDARARNALDPKKDVDGVTDASLAGVFTASGVGFPPCTPDACMQLLDHYGVDVSGKRAVVIGRSLVVGKPVAMLLLQRNATVTLCHTRTRDLPALCREADILIAAAGQAGMVGKDFFAPGQIVLDVGIHPCGDGTLCGDVDFAAAEPVVSAVTPVPGGVGAVTTSVLARHVLDAAEAATLF